MADVANQQNLIPNSERTPNQRREQAQKAGIASGEARRKKKTMRDAARMLMDMKVTGNNKENLQKMGFADIP